MFNRNKEKFNTCKSIFIEQNIGTFLLSEFLTRTILFFVCVHEISKHRKLNRISTFDLKKIVASLTCNVSQERLKKKKKQYKNIEHFFNHV